MKKVLLFISLIFMFIFFAQGQKIIYSNYDNRDISFEIIGKMNNNILVYKNYTWKHKICIYDADMNIKENIKLDFIPEKTINVDIVPYNDFFYMIYQYQKKNIIHCMAVKIDSDGKKINEPIEIDTTQVSILADNKIYNTIFSDDKQKIMVYKIPKKNDKYSLSTLLLDANLKIIAKSKQSIIFDDRRDNYSNFLIDNDGDFIFTKDSKTGNKDNINSLNLIIKQPTQDTFATYQIDLNNHYIDEVKVKIDNLNKQYLINSFYYNKSRGSIEGLFSYCWNKATMSSNYAQFNFINDTLRDEAKLNGQLRFALDNYFLRQIFVKKDGGFLITCEDYSTQSKNNSTSWNRWDYLNNSYYNSNSYYYNPYSGNYRPLNNFGTQSTRYYYDNILVLSIDKMGKQEWGKVIHKEQYDEDNDNFLSYSTYNSGGQIHFLFNDVKNRNEIIANQSILPNGTLIRNPTLKSQEKGYQFMPKLSKQIGFNQLIIPCIYLGNICFAKIEF